jgi:hypothetical protein
MDRDMWDGGERGETLRGWFQKNAKAQERELWNGERTGFLVPNPNRTVPGPDVMQVKHYESRLLNRTPYNAYDKGPAGEYFSMPPPQDDY